MLNAASISWDMNNQCHLVAKKQLSDICMYVKHIFFFFKLHRMKLIVLVSRYWCINFYFMITILTILGFINFVNKIIDIIYRILITRRFCKFFNKIGLFKSIFLCYRWDCNARNRETNKYEGLRRENRRRLRRTIKVADCKQYDRTISLFVWRRCEMRERIRSCAECDFARGKWGFEPSENRSIFPQARIKWRSLCGILDVDCLLTIEQLWNVVGSNVIQDD